MTTSESLFFRLSVGEESFLKIQVITCPSFFQMFSSLYLSFFYFLKTSKIILCYSALSEVKTFALLYKKRRKSMASILHWSNVACEFNTIPHIEAFLVEPINQIHSSS